MEFVYTTTVYYLTYDALIIGVFGVENKLLISTDLDSFSSLIMKHAHYSASHTYNIDI